MSDNFTTHDLQPLASCAFLKAIGSYAAIMLFFSFLFNTLLIWIYFKYKEVRTPLNLLQVTLAILNLIASFIEFPTLMVNSFSCGFVVGKKVCIFTGFIMYYVGCVGIYIIMIISFERYWVLHKPTNMRILSFKVCGIAICIASVLSFIWAFAPIVGWSYYSIEGVGVGCSVEWADRSGNVISYNITIFVTAFIAPFIVLLFTNFKLLSIMKKSRKRMETTMSAQQITRKYIKERSLTIITVILIVLFLFSWVPYAAVCMYVAFINTNGVSPIVATLPALFAKTSLIWPSLWQIIANRDFRKRVKFWRGNAIEPSTLNSTLNAATRNTIRD